MFHVRHRRSLFGRRAFFVVDPMTWNSLTDSLLDPTLSDNQCRIQDLQTGAKVERVSRRRYPPPSRRPSKSVRTRDSKRQQTQAFWEVEAFYK